MLERFEGDAGRRLRIEALKRSKMVAGNAELADRLDACSQLLEFNPGAVLIHQDGEDNDVFFILAGQVTVSVNGRAVATRYAGDTVGEMAALEPTQRRSATVSADEVTVIAKVREVDLAALGEIFPPVYRSLAQELAKRLKQRNSLIGTQRDKIRVFMISSAEGLEIARLVQNALAHDDFLVEVWTDGVFRIADYPLEALERAIEASDFAVAIAHEDDVTVSRGQRWPAPRDNVIFELGMFLGRLGRHRAILMEPVDQAVKKPSDMSGVTTVRYRYEKRSTDAVALIAPACNILRTHFNQHGPNI